MIRYLLLDAGGTVVFPDEHILSDVAGLHGHATEPAALSEALGRVLYKYDDAWRNGGTVLPGSAPPLFQELFETASVPCEAASKCAAEVMSRHEALSLWTFTHPWVKPALEQLRDAGWPMTIVSNSDGRVYQHLVDCELDHFFEQVFDSHIVGIEKPDPRFFQHALDELGLLPEDALYVGDIFCVDVFGANRAGIGAVHLDALGLYQDWPGVHLRSISDLPAWLEDYQRNPDNYDLFPTRSMTA
jgi:putative hydrolase of the HAD superfamily